MAKNNLKDALDITKRVGPVKEEPKDEAKVGFYFRWSLVKKKNIGVLYS